MGGMTRPVPWAMSNLGLLQEAALLYSEGEGIKRFYRGYAARFMMVAINGAIFNWIFVAFKGAVDR